MKLEKALEIVGDIIRYQHSASHSDQGDALMLLCQAGHRILFTREANKNPNFMLLTGETK